MKSEGQVKNDLRTWGFTRSELDAVPDLLGLYLAARAWGQQTCPHVVAEWFRAPHPLLGGQRPLDLCAAGESARVTAFVEAGQAGEVL